MRFREGDIVKISKKSFFYGSNPMSANPMGVEGKIHKFDPTGLPIEVKWTNGEKNSYDEDDLKLVRRADA